MQSKILQEKGIYGSPDLIVEILSPSTAKNDKGYKKQLYEKSGIKRILDRYPKEHQIEVYLLKDGKYELDNVYTGYAAHELEDMTEKEKSDICMEFKCSLYDDLIISVEKVFAQHFKIKKTAPGAGTPGTATVNRSQWSC